MLSEGGIDDILLITIFTVTRNTTLLQLSTRCNLSVVADISVCVKGLSETFKQDKPLQVLVEAILAPQVWSCNARGSIFTSSRDYRLAWTKVWWVDDLPTHLQQEKQSIFRGNKKTY